LKISTFILFTLLLVGLRSFEQLSSPVKTFHAHTNICHYVGSIEEDFIIELFNDSTIKISRYRTSYVDAYNSVLRLTYSGTYTIDNDTLRIKYLAHCSEVKYKVLPAVLSPNSKESVKFVLLPSSTFIVKNDLAEATDNLFPVLLTSTHRIVDLLDYTFDYWDRPKPHKLKRFDLANN